MRIVRSCNPSWDGGRWESPSPQCHYFTQGCSRTPPYRQPAAQIRAPPAHAHVRGSVRRVSCVFAVVSMVAPLMTALPANLQPRPGCSYHSSSLTLTLQSFGPALRVHGLLGVVQRHVPLPFSAIVHLCIGTSSQGTRATNLQSGVSCFHTTAAHM